MREIKSTRLLWIKAGLFLLLGFGSAALLLAEAPDFKVGLLLTVVVWAFCRAYYFAFYVIEHYTDASFRYSGLISFGRHLLRRMANR